jgi:hypothetical protein
MEWALSNLMISNLDGTISRWSVSKHIGDASFSPSLDDTSRLSSHAK